MSGRPADAKLVPAIQVPSIYVQNMGLQQDFAALGSGDILESCPGNMSPFFPVCVREAARTGRRRFIPTRCVACIACVELVETGLSGRARRPNFGNYSRDRTQDDFAMPAPSVQNGRSSSAPKVGGPDSPDPVSGPPPVSTEPCRLSGVPSAGARCP